MRNLKRALSLTLASIMLLGMMVVGSSAASYKDVTDDHNVEAIEVLQAVGIMVGDDGNFNPDKNVTRNEMAVIMSNLMDYRVASYAGTSPFTDVPSWAEPYVAACYTNGITSGVSATSYGGSGNVTTAQAALMVMKALGYFQYAADFKEDWMLETTRQANNIDLLVDVKAGVRDAMTRNDVAQLVLNGLEAGTVEADTSNKIDVSVGGGTVSVGGDTKYSFVTSTRDYAFAINNARSTTDNTDATASVVELGEKLYNGDLTKDSWEDGNTDDFRRPADTWEYQNKSIGTYTKDANYTWTAGVTAKQLFNAVGQTVTDTYNWLISVDGVRVVDSSRGWSALDINKNDDDSSFLTFAGVADADRTGNGTVTEVFLDSANRRVYVSVTHLYAAEVLRVYSDDGAITLSDLHSGPALAGDSFDTTDFEEDEIVVYTYAADRIQSVVPATRMEGQITRVRTGTTSGGNEVNADGDQFIVDGETYAYNKTVDSDARLQTENVNNNMVGYLDPYGYCIYIDESAISYDYAYILSVGDGNDTYGGSDNYGARLVLTDGTMVKADTDINTDSEKAGFNNAIVSYSKDRSNVYSVVHTWNGSTNQAKVQSCAAGSDLKIESGKSSFTTPGGTYAANSKTVFVVAETDPDGKFDNYSFSVYTGINNVPDIDGRGASTKVAVSTEKDSNLAKVVYIEDANMSGSEVIFIRADRQAKLVDDSEIGNYYQLNAWVGGEAVTLNIRQNSPAADTLVKATAGDLAARGVSIDGNSRRYIVPVKTITYNTDELVTYVRPYDVYDPAEDDGFLTGTGTGKTSNGLITLNSMDQGNKPGASSFTWTENVVMVQYNDRSNTARFTASRPSAVKDDTNDKYVVVMDGDVIAGLCTVYVAGGENGSGTASYTVSVTGSTANMTVTGTGSFAAGSDVTVTFRANAGYIFTENGQTTITRTITNLTANTSIEAPAVQEGVEKITLKLDLGAGITYVTVDNKNLASGVVTGDKGEVKLFTVTKGTGVSTVSVRFCPDDNNTAFEDITDDNNSGNYAVPLTKNGTLYVTASTSAAFQQAKNDIENYVFDLYTQVDVSNVAEKGGLVQYFSNDQHDARDDEWSTVVGINRWSTGDLNSIRGNEQTEMAALTDFIFDLGTRNGFDLKKGNGKIGIAADGGYWSAVSVIKAGEPGHDGGANPLYVRTLTVKLHDANENATDTIGTITVKYHLNQTAVTNLSLPVDP